MQVSTAYAKNEANFRNLRKNSLLAGKALGTKQRGHADCQLVKSFAPGADQLMLWGGEKGQGGVKR